MANGRIGTVGQWVGVVTGPIAWATHLLLSSEVEELGCASAVRELGFDAESFIVAETLGLAALTLAAGVISYGHLRRVRRNDATPGGRATWIATAGVLTSIVFLVIILLGLLPPAFLESCRSSL
jgi:Zn-dependent protease